jgi:signal transduction histidine kinase
VRLEDLVLAVVRGPDSSERAARLLGAAGGLVRLLDVNEIALDLEPHADVIVLDAGGSPEVFSGFAAALATFASARSTPVLALVDGELPAHRCQGLGGAALFDRTADDAALTARMISFIQRTREVASNAPHERLDAVARDAPAVVHDARVLCGVALGYGANLRDGFAGALSPEQASHVTQVLSAVTDLGALLDRFATAVRAQADGDDALPPSERRAVRRRVHCDIAQTVQQCVSMLGALALEKTIELSVDAPHPLRLWCDRTQLKQVVTNLVVNAIKFTPERGRVFVTVGMSDESPGEGMERRRSARLVVTDTGPGVRAEDRERIFDRGYRAARHAAVPGSGIGLSVVREVVHAHGGSVRVEEVAAGGAAFVVDLPIDLRRRRDRESTAARSDR